MLESPLSSILIKCKWINHNNVVFLRIKISFLIKMKIDSSHSMIIIIIKWGKLIKCKLWIYNSHAVEKDVRKGKKLSTKGAFQTYLFRNIKFIYWISWLKVFSISSAVSIILWMAFHYYSFNTEDKVCAQCSVLTQQKEKKKNT